MAHSLAGRNGYAAVVAAGAAGVAGIAGEAAGVAVAGIAAEAAAVEVAPRKKCRMFEDYYPSATVGRLGEGERRSQLPPR